MPLDFPTNPKHAQVFDKYIYDSATSSWLLADSVYALSLRVYGVEQLAPPGSIHMFAGSSAPQGYMFCEGQAVSRSTYASLFNGIGTTYGTGDGSTTFNVPDLRGRLAVGKTSSGTFASLNNKGGAETHTLSIAEMPTHTHIQNKHTHTQDSHTHSGLYIDSTPLRWGLGFAGGSAGAISNSGTGQTPYTGTTTATNQYTVAVNQNTGGGGAHNNLQPYNTVNYIIKF